MRRSSTCCRPCGSATPGHGGRTRVAIITGGNSGISQAIVLELARLGANVVIDYVCHPEATEALEQEVASLGRRSPASSASSPATVQAISQQPRSSPMAALCTERRVVAEDREPDR